MDNYSDVKQHLETVKAVIASIRNSDQIDPAIYTDIFDAVNKINLHVFNSTVIKFNSIDEYLSNFGNYHKEEIADKIEAWVDFVYSVINNRSSQKNIWDMKFIILMDYIRYVEYDSILYNSKSVLKEFSEEIQNQICAYYQNYSFWGRLDIKNNIYEVLEERIRQLIDHRDDFIWLYNRLSDYRSRIVLCCMLLNWISFDPDNINTMMENNFPNYFDLDLVRCSDKEVFVDLGAFTGNTTLDFINTYRSYKKIYCYEITPSSYAQMQESLSRYANVELRNRGAGDQEGIIPNTEIKVVTIDDDIPEKVTMIKMDIEGAEYNAIEGCRRHILHDRPKLLLSVYHNNIDIWRIPTLINSIRDDYKFYLRSNGSQIGPSEITFYAL